MVWYRVDMTVDSLRDGAFHRLCREFQQAFIANGAPNEMALFAQAEPSDGTRRVYFTPGCTSYVQQLIDGYGGRPCATPDDGALTLMFGVPGAESVAFIPGGDGISVDGVPVPENLATIAEADGRTKPEHHVK